MMTNQQQEARWALRAYRDMYIEALWRGGEGRYFIDALLPQVRDQIIRDHGQADVAEALRAVLRDIQGRLEGPAFYGNDAVWYIAQLIDDALDAHRAEAPKKN